MKAEQTGPAVRAPSSSLFELLRQVLGHRQMHFHSLVGLARETFDCAVVTTLGIAAHEYVGFLVGRNLLGDVAMIEIACGDAPQIVEHSLAPIIDMRRRFDI